MPSGIAKIVREMFSGVDKTDLVVETSWESATGFKQVIKANDGEYPYQARLHAPGQRRWARRCVEAQATPAARPLLHGA